MFYVHEHIICNASPVLAAAFGGLYREGLKKSYRLDYTSPETVNRLIQWLYGQKLDIYEPAAHKIEPKDFYHAVFELYVLADKYQIQALKHYVIDIFARILPESYKGFPDVSPSGTNVSYLWVNTTKACPLRQIVLSLLVYHLDPAWLESERGKSFLALVPECAVDLVPVLAHRIANPSASCNCCGDLTRYHV